MDEEIRFHVTLADGTEFDAVSDGAGNMIAEGVEEESFSPDNLSEVRVSENGGEAYVLENQVLRMFFVRKDGSVLIHFSEMDTLEKIEADYNAKIDYIAAMTGVDLDE